LSSTNWNVVSADPTNRCIGNSAINWQRNWSLWHAAFDYDVPFRGRSKTGDSHARRQLSQLPMRSELRSSPVVRPSADPATFSVGDRVPRDLMATPPCGRGARLRSMRARRFSHDDVHRLRLGKQSSYSLEGGSLKARHEANDCSEIRKVGRPRNASDIRQVVLDMARDNSGWVHENPRCATRAVRQRGLGQPATLAVCRSRLSVQEGGSLALNESRLASSTSSFLSTSTSAFPCGHFALTQRRVSRRCCHVLRWSRDRPRAPPASAPERRHVTAPRPSRGARPRARTCPRRRR